MPKKEDKIYKILQQIENNLERQNSSKRIFVQGLVRGLGTALGATVLLAVITSLAIQLASTFDATTIIEYFFNDAIID
jgi:hypothetical protein